MVLVRVVLINYRCFDDIAHQLESGALDGTQVVLVDNASDPDRIGRLGAQHRARVILMPENVGFARAVNAAIGEPDQPEARHDAVLLLNPDVTLSSRDLDELSAVLERSGADATGPVLVDEKGTVWVSSAGGPVSLPSVCWYFLGLSHVFRRLSGFFWTRRQIVSGGPATPHWLCGACMLVRRDAFERFGGLPTEEIVYGEDVGWGVDAVAQGGVLHLARDVVVVHSGGGSGGSDAWVGATERTLVRRLGRLRGGLAVAVMRLGLAARRRIRAVLR